MRRRGVPRLRVLQNYERNGEGRTATGRAGGRRSSTRLTKDELANLIETAVAAEERQAGGPALNQEERNA